MCFFSRGKDVDKQLDPYDPYGNDTKTYVYSMYDVFMDDSYVGNNSGTYWIGIAEFVRGADPQVRSPFLSPRTSAGRPRRHPLLPSPGVEGVVLGPPGGEPDPEQRDDDLLGQFHPTDVHLWLPLLPRGTRGVEQRRMPGPFAIHTDRLVFF